ncbi:MAG: heme-dependent oxidative N-demethylase subunit alpha family protein [Pseudomonadota bacterium]
MRLTFDHAPYLRPRADFALGLGQAPLSSHLEIDDDRAPQLARKATLWRERRPLVFAAEPGSEAAQREALEVISAAVPGAPGASSKAWREPNTPPLAAAALAVQEDLVVMRASACAGEGDPVWRLSAGAVFFPSRWSLRANLGAPFLALHGPVPGLSGAAAARARAAQRALSTARADRLLERFGWSLTPDAAPDQRPAEDGGLGRDAFAQGVIADPHVRVERQTLRKLPRSGAVLFTIRIHVTRARDLAARPDGATRLHALADSLMALSPATAAYKGLDGVREALADHLRDLAT